MSKPDFGNAAQDYRQYRQGFPAEFFKRLRSFGIGVKGQKVLDLGTGTGNVARGLAREGCEVTGLDISEKLINEAKILDQEIGVKIHYVIKPAEATSLPGHSFDVITAGQCWHWFDQSKIIAEVQRLLKPDGTLVIAHNDFIPLRNNVAALSDRLTLKYEPKLPFQHERNGLHTEWVLPLNEGGFNQLETFSFDYIAEYSHEAWRGRIRASAPVGGSLSPEKVAEFDQEHSAALKAHFPEEPLKILHRCFVIVARRGI